MKEFHTKLKSNNFQDSKHELCETDRQKNGWVWDEQITRITKRITVNSFLTDTSIRRTPRLNRHLEMVSAFPYIFWWSDISLKRTHSAGPKGVHLGENWLREQAIHNHSYPICYVFWMHMSVFTISWPFVSLYYRVLTALRCCNLSARCSIPALTLTRILLALSWRSLASAFLKTNKPYRNTMVTIRTWIDFFLTITVAINRV